MPRILCVWLPGLRIGDETNVAFRSAKVAPARYFRGAKGDSATVDFPGLKKGGDAVDDRALLAALAERCARFSPLVGIEPSPAPDSLLLDITGLAHLFGGEAALARQVLDDFVSAGHVVRVAVADTVGAAWAAARFAEDEGRGAKGEGREEAEGEPTSICNLQFAIPNLQSSSRAPRPSARPPVAALWLIPPRGALAALRPLPIEALRLSEEIVDVLHQLGIWRIEQLEGIPREEFLSRFGPGLLRRWDQALGRLAEPIPGHQPPPEFTANLALEYPTTRRETIDAALEQLLADVAVRLADCGRGATRVACRLDCVAAAAVRVSIGVYQPTAAPRHLLELVAMQLERLRLPAAVTAVEVAAVETAPLEYRQQALFHESEAAVRASPRHLAGLIDRLSSRLGRRAVLHARLAAEAQPELACRYDPLVGGPRRRRGRLSAGDLPPRPLRLLARPVPLSRVGQGREEPGGTRQTEQLVICDLPEAHRESATEVPPMLRFACPTLQGPERIETGWWRGHAVGRDYYRVETTAGQRLWLFRRLRDGRWFLHGVFE